jgi:hypothetical protein
MFRVTFESRATGLTEVRFDTFDEAKKYIDNFYGVGFFHFKLYEDDEMIDENIFGIGWSFIKGGK